MSVKTRYGNLGNIYAEDPSQTAILQLQGPVMLARDVDAFLEHFRDKVVRIDCTFDTKAGNRALGEALERIRAEAEDAVRGGYEQIVLSDEAIAPDRAPIPMVLATGAVHSHLVRQGLRSFSSITVKTGECIDTHTFAVLIGVGATSVNAYLTEAAIADRHARGLFSGLTLEECLERYREAIEQGLLKIISKMGISIVSSYRGGYNFEAVGLSRSLCAEYFPGLPTRISGIGLSGIRTVSSSCTSVPGTPTARPCSSAASIVIAVAAKSTRSRVPWCTSSSTPSPRIPTRRTRSSWSSCTAPIR